MSKHIRLDTVKDQLEAAQADLFEKAEVLRGELASVERHLHRVDTALSALFDPVSPPTNGKAPKKKKTFGPSASKVQVIEFMTHALSKSNILQEQELRQQVEKQLTQSGLTRIGFALRFKEALADSRFVSDEHGIKLT